MQDQAQGNKIVVSFAVFTALAVLVVIAYAIWSFEVKREAERRRQEECLENIRQVMRQMKQYNQDFLESYPWALEPGDSGSVGWSGRGFLFPHYDSGFKRFFAPSAKDPSTMLDKESGDQSNEPAPDLDEAEIPQAPAE
jgi:hypothetical protein